MATARGLDCNGMTTGRGHGGNGVVNGFLAVRYSGAGNGPRTDPKSGIFSVRRKWFTAGRKPSDNTGRFSFSGCVLSLPAPAASVMKVRSLYYGTTPTMDAKWDALQKLENDTYLQIIVGDKPVEAFDDFVLQWKELGGNQVTEEVSQIVNGVKP
ncbi:hypothetical protein [Paenibacillus sp. MMO-177]|uniref:hypothetical protein n=1 Tax=Paenibacillus sp. MMO-177 TaxID=3081289 RepID=UPI003019D30E